MFLLGGVGDHITPSTPTRGFRLYVGAQEMVGSRREGQRRLEAEPGQLCPQSSFRNSEDRAGSVLACSLSLRVGGRVTWALLEWV